MLSTNEKGARSEGAVLAQLLRHGYNVLIPFGVSRYDLVIEDDEGIFRRVQVKTGRVDKAGALRFNVCSTPPGGRTRNYDGQVDYFGVYVPDIDAVYLFTAEVVAGRQRQVSFRLQPARNGQTSGTRLAEPYRLVAQQDRAPVS